MYKMLSLRKKLAFLMPQPCILITLASAIPLTMSAGICLARFNPITISSEEAEPEGGIVRIPLASLGAAADTDA